MDESDETQREVAEAQAREPRKERLEREHKELIDELRALIPGAQVLFGFLLVIRFSNQFRDLDSGQRNAFYGTLISTAVALVLFLAPSAHHRIRFREGDKDYMLRKGNREAIVGSVAIALAFTGTIYLVTDLVFGTLAAALAAAGVFLLIAWRWWALALYRSLTDADGHDDMGDPGFEPGTSALSERRSNRLS